MKSTDPAELDAIVAKLAEFIDPEHIGPWLDRPSNAFGGRTPRTPRDLIASGESERVWAMVRELETGAHS